MTRTETWSGNMATENKRSHNGSTLSYEGQKVKSFLLEYQYAIYFLVVVLLIWTAGVRVLNIPEFVLPTPSAILFSFQGEVGTLIHHARYTFLAAFIGWVLGNIIGISLGIIMAESQKIKKATYPYIIILRAVPVIAFAPLLLLWFGFGLTPIIVAAILTTFFSTLVNSITGFNATNDLTMELMRSYDASRWDRLKYVKIYGALPYVFSALKINVALSLVGAVVGEWLVGDQGAGYLILVASNQVNTLLLFRAIIVIGVLATIWFAILAVVESRIINWQSDAGQGATR